MSDGSLSCWGCPGDHRSIVYADSLVYSSYRYYYNPIIILLHTVVKHAIHSGICIMCVYYTARVDCRCRRSSTVMTDSLSLFLSPFSSLLTSLLFSTLDSTLQLISSPPAYIYTTPLLSIDIYSLTDLITAFRAVKPSQQTRLSTRQTALFRCPFCHPPKILVFASVPSPTAGD